MISSDPPEIFLCHASEDKEFVVNFYRRLSRDGFRPWLDVLDLVPGQRWEEEIRLALRRCAAVVVFISRFSIREGRYVQREVDIALEEFSDKEPGSLYIVPIGLDSSDLPPVLGEWHFIHLDQPDGYRLLRRALATRAQQIGTGGQLPKAWRLPRHLLRIPIGHMSQVQVRSWLKEIGEDWHMFPEEEDQAWPKTYNSACEILEGLKFMDEYEED